MSLRETAEADLSFIIEDDVGGFGWPIVLTNPSGVSGNFTGFSSDIAQVIDPETGQAVSGRRASVVLRTSSLVSSSIGIPQGISDASVKPWIVQFDDINGNSYKFKVSQSDPDRALGVVVCLLELYE